MIICIYSDKPYQVMALRVMRPRYNIPIRLCAAGFNYCMYTYIRVCLLGDCAHCQLRALLEASDILCCIYSSFFAVRLRWRLRRSISLPSSNHPHPHHHPHLGLMMIIRRWSVGRTCILLFHIILSSPLICDIY